MSRGARVRWSDSPLAVQLDTPSESILEEAGAVIIPKDTLLEAHFEVKKYVESKRMREGI